MTDCPLCGAAMIDITAYGEPFRSAFLCTDCGEQWITRAGVLEPHRETWQHRHPIKPKAFSRHA